MSYVVKGNVSITKSPEMETEFALNFDAFLESIDPYFEFLPGEERPSIPLFQEASGWAWLVSVPRWGDYSPDANGCLRLDFTFSGKWRHMSSRVLYHFLKYCASVGMQVEADFTGEDQEKFGYYAPLNSRAMRETTLLNTPQDTLTVLLDRSASVNNLKALIESGASDETIRASVKDWFDTETPALAKGHVPPASS